MLEAALTNTVRARKCAFFVTEQLRLNQVFWNRGHIESDKRFVGARAMAVKGMSNQLFTRTGLPVDQNGNRRARKAANSAEHFLHCWRFTDDLWRVGWGIF
ncbi:hypothetical protein D039_1383 [Vibrio parahaemolyticus EKP-028]|nr:hypothetical protein D039_1383 [Vibrio parahaemolyticus EKP-028]